MVLGAYAVFLGFCLGLVGLSADGTDLFYIASGKQVYGLNGVSALGSYAPQEVYEQLVNYYRTTNQFTDLDAPEELSQMGRRAGEIYRARFTGEIFAKKIEDIYLDILKGAKS